MYLCGITSFLLFLKSVDFFARFISRSAFAPAFAGPRDSTVPFWLQVAIKSAVIQRGLYCTRRYILSFLLYTHIRMDTSCIVPDTTFSCPCRRCRCSCLLLFSCCANSLPPQVPPPPLPIRRLSAIYKRMPPGQETSQFFCSFGPSLTFTFSLLGFFETRINTPLCKSGQDGRVQNGTR